MPGLVIWGDTLSLQTRRIFYTPEFFLGKWEEKMKQNAKII